MESLKYKLPGSADEVVTAIVAGSSAGKPSKNKKPDAHDIGISQTTAGAFDSTSTNKNKVEVRPPTICEILL